MTPTTPAGAEPSPEEAAATEITNCLADGLRACGCSVSPHDYANDRNRYLAILTPFFAPLRAELERVKGERDIYRKQWAEGQDIIHRCGSDIAELQKQLALANAKAEEARRAGVKTFDESHPDDLQARIHATIKEHERLWMNGGYIYLSSYLAKAIFEMLNQPLK